MFAKKNKYHSGLLAQGEEPVNIYRRRLQILVSFILLAIVMMAPSHQIANIITVKFPFEFPGHVSQGGLITFPVRESDELVGVGKERPSKLAKQNLYASGFGLQSPAGVTVWSLSKPQRLGWFKRQWLSLPIEYSEQTIVLDRLPPRAPVAIHLPSLVRQQLRRVASVDVAKESETAGSLLNRTDGAARLDCWQSPLPFAMSNDFGTTHAFDNGQTVLHESLDIKANVGTALKTAGAGEVVGVDTLAIPGHVITIYHGDGLYTRYSHLHEFQTHVGEKVAAGQMIGFSGNSGQAESPYLRFEVIWKGQHLNPAEVLKVSQQLCGETKSPLVQKTDRADRSPASKIYRWMSQQGRQQ